MKADNTIFKGVCAALITPFKEDGTIDEDSFLNHIEFLIERGINGLFIAGTTGLGIALSLNERLKLIDLLSSSKVYRNKVYTIMHVTDISVNEAREIVRYVSRKDIDAIAIMPPYFYSGIDERGIQEFIEYIVKDSSLPIFIYNQPRYTGINVRPEVIRKLRDSYPNIIGLKDSSGDLTKLYEYIVALGKDLVVMTGSDAIFYPSLLLGAKGIVSALANLIPEHFVTLYKDFIEGRHKEALEIQEFIIKVRTILKKYPQLSAYYEAGRLLGLNVGFPRLPIRRLTSDERDALRKELKSIGLINK